MANVADYNVANASGASVRSDLNNILQAVVTLNSGTSAPSTMYPFMIWIDTNANLVKMRNGANDAWLTMPFAMNASNSVDINAGTIDGVSLGSGSAITSAVISGDLTVDTDTLKVTSASDLVHIGNTSTGFHSSVHPLIVGSGSGDEGMAIFSGSSNKGKLGFADAATDDSGSYRGYLQYDHSGDNLNIGTAGSEVIRVDSAGRLLLGSESVVAHANMDDLQIGAGSGSKGINIYSGSGDYGTIAFGDGSGSNSYRGFVEYYHNEDSMRFGTSSLERMRIASDGKVSVPHGITSGQGGNDGNNVGIKMSEYDLTINSENVTAGYVDVETNINRANYLGCIPSIYDSTANVAKMGYRSDGGFVTYADGYTNIVRVGLGGDVAASDIVKIVVMYV